MPKFLFYKFDSTTGLADGSTWEAEYTADEDYIIKRIYIKRMTGEDLTKSKVTFLLAGVPITKPEALAYNFGPDILVNPELDLRISKGGKLSWTFKNLEGVAIDVGLTLEIWSVE